MDETMVNRSIPGVYQQFQFKNGIPIGKKHLKWKKA